MRMTDGQVKAAVERMNTTREIKDRLIAQALGGDMGARLVVYGVMKRQKKYGWK